MELELKILDTQKEEILRKISSPAWRNIAESENVISWVEQERQRLEREVAYNKVYGWDRDIDRGIEM